jgi:hypothetical protein
MAFDIWRARQKPQPEIARIQAVLRANGGIGWGLIRSTAQSLIVQLGAAIRISILRYSSREMRHQLPRFCKDSKRVATIGSPPIRRRF